MYNFDNYLVIFHYPNGKRGQDTFFCRSDIEAVVEAREEYGDITISSVYVEGRDSWLPCYDWM